MWLRKEDFAAMGVDAVAAKVGGQKPAPEETGAESGAIVLPPEFDWLYLTDDAIRYEKILPESCHNFAKISRIDFYFQLETRHLFCSRIEHLPFYVFLIFFGFETIVMYF